MTETANFIDDLTVSGACEGAIEWVKENNITSRAESWQKCPRADWMLWGLSRSSLPVDANKIRLFACRVCREQPLGDGRVLWDLLTDERSRNVVIVAERFARGEATSAELRAALAAAEAAAWAAAWAAAGDAARAAARAAWAAGNAARAAGNAARAAASLWQADLLREMYGNPCLKACE